MAIKQTVKFPFERCKYKIQARDDRYLICTRPHFKTYMYTIIDLQESIRATDNTIFGLEYGTVADCEERLKELQSGEIDLSWRNRKKINIDELIYGDVES